MEKRNSCYVREQKRYSRKELIRMISADEEFSARIIKELCYVRCLSRLKNSSPQTNLDEISVADFNDPESYADDENSLYVFTYVGVIVIGSVVFMCYPKFYSSAAPDARQMKQIFEVINRYNSERSQGISHLSGHDQVTKFNLLPIVLFLLNDYYDYGIYIKDEEVTEVNGDGCILWDKTVNETIPLFSDGRPYYIDIFDRRTADNNENLITRLHAVILDECSDYMAGLGLLDILSIEEINISDESRELLGDDDSLMNAVSQEINLQFNTRKLILLRTIQVYLFQSHARKREETVSFYGTSAFYDVWEKACAKVFDDCLHKKLFNLPYGSFPYDDNNNKKLIELIEKPLWEEKYVDKGGIQAVDTLIPDIICVETKDEKKIFVIMDAKYYNMELNESKGMLSGQPGIESIAKQYLYQLAYTDFLRCHRVDYIANCFIMPAENDRIVVKGTVSMDLFHQINIEPELVKIQACFLPAYRLFEYYLHGKHMSVLELGLDM